MKKTLFKLYFILVCVLVLLFSYSYVYRTYLHENMYLKYIPEDAVSPKYDARTGKVSNSDDNIYWEPSDYVPLSGIISWKIFKFTKSNALLLFPITVGLFVYFLVIHKKIAVLEKWLLFFSGILLIISFLVLNKMIFYM